MTNPSSVPLRLFVEQPPDEQPGLDLPQFAALARAFEKATGWQLRCEHAPAVPGEVWSTTLAAGQGNAFSRLVLARGNIANETDRGGADAPPLDLQLARPLALALGDMLGELNHLRCAVWQREAELAAGVPVAIRAEGEPHLAERLEAVLQGGAEAVDCQAAGLYLLDEHTSELKLRACFNLPPERLLAPARPLRGAVADLEALVGHAVVLEDTRVLPHWRCPEDFPSAVCVPVSSPTTPLGTLWIFSKEPRDFSPNETNLIEIVAGRLAADLEREMLVVAGSESKARNKAFDRAASWLSDRLPSVTPLLEEYDVAGWTRAANGPAASFHDWTVLPDGRLALAVADTHERSLVAALDTAALHAALKSHSSYPHGAAELLSRLNETLWTTSPGDQRSALAYALLDTESGRVELALAGDMAAIAAGLDDYSLVTASGPLLGEAPAMHYDRQQILLAAGDALVLVSGGVRRATDLAGLKIGDAALASCIRKHLRETAEGLVARLRRLLDHGQPQAADMSLVVLKRRGERD